MADESQIKVLVIEDNPEIVQAVGLFFRLRWEGARVVFATEGARGLQLAQTENPDIVILDLGLPDMDGYEVLRQLRLFSNVPVIILTVREEVADKVKGLDGGADDYIVKPFSALDLLSRVKAVVRRSRLLDRKEESSPVFRAGNISIDFAGREVTVNGKVEHLAPREFDLLSCLVKNAGRVVSHEELVKAAWGSTFIEASTLKKYIHLLREKLQDTSDPPAIIVSERSIGYMFRAPGRNDSQAVRKHKPLDK
jgi:DNA-binding response OmpR family regulator